MNKIIHGDCIEKLKELPDSSIDSIVTDPPYHLVSIVKRFGKEGSAPAQFGTDGAFSRASKGFMGKTWDGLGEDGIGIANNPSMWAECLRVLKPGGHLLAFSGTRTYHRMASAIEDAGFEVRDMIEWCYGSGFPKSLNIGKKVDELQGNEREVVGTKRCGIADSPFGSVEESRKHIPDTKGTSAWEGWGTALKPAHEPICMARKPLAEKTVAENCLKWGTGGINIDESRVGTEDKLSIHKGAVGFKGSIGSITKESFKSEGQSLGRFPANLIHDNSEEVRECFPESTSGARKKGDHKEYDASSYKFGGLYSEDVPAESGNASRFFKSIIYQAKASKSERNKGCEELEEKRSGSMVGNINDANFLTGSGNKREGKNRNNHPTVKPIALMEYLIKMVTPKNGTVLDPFAGSGSTGVACNNLNLGYILIEKEADYVEIIKKRLGL